MGDTLRGPIFTCHNQPLKFEATFPLTPHMPKKENCFTFWVGQKGGNLRDLKGKDGVANDMGLRFQGPTLQTESAIDEG